MNRNHAAHLAALAANLLYGANYSIAKEVMPAFIKPFGFILIRVSITTILFALCAYFFSKEKIEKADRNRLILCAVFGIAVNQLLFFKGLSLTSPIDSGLMMVTNPIFVLLLSGIFLSEIINARRIFGIICGISGAVLLILFGHRFSASGNSSLAGDLFVLINSLSFAIYIVLIKPLMGKYHPFTIMPLVFASGTLMVFPFGFEEFKQIEWSSFTPSIWAATAFVVIGTTFLAYLFNMLALRQLSAGVVSVYIYLQPLFAAAFAMLAGKDSLNVIHFLSAALIFSGVYLTTTGLAVKNRISS